MAISAQKKRELFDSNFLNRKSAILFVKMLSVRGLVVDFYMGRPEICRSERKFGSTILSAFRRDADPGYRPFLTETGVWYLIRFSFRCNFSGFLSDFTEIIYKKTVGRRGGSFLKDASLRVCEDCI